MNKYLIPICDIGYSLCWIKTIQAKSLQDCKEKLIEELTYEYGIKECDSYNSFCEVADSEYDIIIGDIKDIDEL